MTKLNPDTKTPPSRRDFVRAAGLGVGAAVAGAASLSVTAVKPAEAAAPKGKNAGYRETEHVKRYYELAKF